MPRRMWQRGPDGEIIRVCPPAPDPALEADGEDGEDGAPAPVPARPRRARLGLALRLGLRDSYDYLGTVVLASLLWCLVTGFAMFGGHVVGRALFGGLPGLLSLLLPLLSAAAGFVLAGGPLAAGLFRYARNAAMRHEPEVFDLGWGFRQALGPSLRLAGLQGLVVLVLGGNCVFYLTQRHPVLVVLGAIFGYLAIAWTLMACYQWPLLVELEQPPLTVVKKSGLLLIDNLPFSLLLGLVFLLFSLAAWLTAIGGVLLWAGAAAMLLTQATRELLRKYGVLGPDPTLDPIQEEVGE